MYLYRSFKSPENTISNTNRYVLGQDSDFVMFRDAPYISFSTLTFERSQDATFEAKARVLSRSRVAKLLNMSENQLVDLAIMFGNDFTAPLLRSKRAREKAFGITIGLDEVDEDVDEFYETRSFAEKLLISFLKINGDLEVKNNNKALDAALKHSREFYNLTCFDLDMKKKTSATKKPTVCLDNVTDSYIEKAAIAEMINTIKSETKDSEFVSSLHFNDVLLSEKYQKMILRYLSYQWKNLDRKHVVRRLSPSIHFATIQHTEEKNWDSIMEMPFKLYHGITFHNILQEYRSSVQDVAFENEEEEKNEEEEEEEEEKQQLPIDAYEDKIIKTCNKFQVTIIRAETGSGKSSRVPAMIFMNDKSSRMFVSQPRRIAAQALYARVSKSIGEPNAVSLRLGGGVRDGDRRARIVFCTAGYVVFERGVRHYRLLIVSQESQFYHSYHLYHPFISQENHSYHFYHPFIISQENHSNSNARMHTLKYLRKLIALEHRYRTSKRTCVFCETWNQDSSFLEKYFQGSSKRRGKARTESRRSYFLGFSGCVSTQHSTYRA